MGCDDSVTGVTGGGVHGYRLVTVPSLRCYRRVAPLNTGDGFTATGRRSPGADPFTHIARGLGRCSMLKEVTAVR